MEITQQSASRTKNYEQTGGNVQENVQENVHNDVHNELTDRQRNILELIRDDNTISYEQMSTRLKVSKKTIQRDVEAMPHVITRVGPDKGGHWEIIDNN